MTACCCVLVVEDDRAIRKLLHRQLTNLGFSVHLARDGSEGYSLWASNPYDLVLTDCSMPKMDGFELASKIRGAGQSRASLVPIIAITGHTADHKSRAASGINDFISKPIAAAELRRVLIRWLPDPMQGLEELDRPLGTTPENQSQNVSALRPIALEDSAIMRSISRTFIKTIPDYLQALGRACAAGSRSDIAAAAHKLKSAAHLVGGTEVANLCKILEESAYGAGSEEIMNLSRRIHETVQVLGNSLKSID